MKKLLIFVTFILVSLNAHALRIFGQEIDVRVEIVNSSVEQHLPDFAKAIGATKYSFQINKSVPQNTSITLCCDLEIAFTFKPTTLEKSYSFLRAMLSKDYGRFIDATPIRALGKKCIMWQDNSGQVLLYAVGESIYIQYYPFSSIMRTYGSL